MIKFKYKGRYMQAINTQIIEKGNRYFVIKGNEFDGDKYYNCFELEKDLITIKNPKKKYNLCPIYDEKNDGYLYTTDFEIEEV